MTTDELAPTETVFFILSTGMVYRNFVTTGFIEKLSADFNLRVICIVNREVLKVAKSTPRTGNYFSLNLPERRKVRLHEFIHAVLRRRHYKIHQTETTKILWKSPISKQSGMSFLRDWILSQPFPNSTIVPIVLGWVLKRLTHRYSSETRKYFSEFEPTLVISTTPGSMREYDILHYAKARSIPIIGIIKSWDNITSKGYFPVKPDLFPVWNEVIVDELEKHHEIPRTEIEVVGVPQFDIYAKRTVTNRELFLDGLGLDPAKKTVLYATSGPQINPDDPIIVDALAKYYLSEGVQVLARLHQVDDIGRYDVSNETDVGYQIPGRAMGDNAGARLVDPKFMLDLRETIFHCDVVVATFSTMNLDALAMDKPVVNIAFDQIDRKKSRSLTRYLYFDHIQVLLKGGVEVARSFEQLVDMINLYIEFPEHQLERRNRLKKKLCFKVDGESTKRLATFISRNIPR